MPITTDKIAELYIGHAGYFRAVLGKSKTPYTSAHLSLMAELPGGSLICRDKQWGWIPNGSETIYDMPWSVGVKAMTETWREEFADDPHIQMRQVPKLSLWTWGVGVNTNTFNSLAEAICDCVRHKAAELLDPENPRTPTEEAEALFIKHRQSFATLLGSGHPFAVASLDGFEIELRKQPDESWEWLWRYRESDHLPPVVITVQQGLASMEQWWKMELQKTPGRLVCDAHGHGWVGGDKFCRTLPEAICAEVELRLVKRQEELIERESLKEPLDPQNPADSTDPIVVATDLSAEVAEIEGSCARLRRTLDMRLYQIAQKRAEAKPEPPASLHDAGKRIADRIIEQYAYHRVGYLGGINRGIQRIVDEELKLREPQDAKPADAPANSEFATEAYVDKEAWETPQSSIAHTDHLRDDIVNAIGRLEHGPSRPEGEHARVKDIDEELKRD